MDTTKLAYTLPDPNWVMPQHAQEVTLAIFGGGAILLVLYAVYMSLSRRTALPLLYCVAGLFSILLEPIADVLANAIHPAVGQINAFVAEGHPIPWHVVVGYIWYFGSAQIFLHDRFVARTMTPALWWKFTAVSFVAVTAVEQIPIYFGVWIYYGEHPFKIGLMPLSMIWANVVSVVIPALVIYRITPILTGWKQLMVLAVVPACVVAGHAGAGAPAYVALGQDTANAPYWILQAGTIATVIFGTLMLWIAIAIVHDRIPNTMPVPRAAANGKSSAGAASHPLGPAVR